MKTERLQIQGIPAVIYGEASEKVWLYVHGKQSAKEAAGRFAETVCAKGWQVLSADLPEHGERSGGNRPRPHGQAEALGKSNATDKPDDGARAERKSREHER